MPKLGEVRRDKKGESFVWATKGGKQDWYWFDPNDDWHSTWVQEVQKSEQARAGGRLYGNDPAVSKFLEPSTGEKVAAGVAGAASATVNKLTDIGTNAMVNMVGPGAFGSDPYLEEFARQNKQAQANVEADVMGAVRDVPGYEGSKAVTGLALDVAPYLVSTKLNAGDIAKRGYSSLLSTRPTSGVGKRRFMSGVSTGVEGAISDSAVAAIVGDNVGFEGALGFAGGFVGGLFRNADYLYGISDAAVSSKISAPRTRERDRTINSLVDHINVNNLDPDAVAANEALQRLTDKYGAGTKPVVQVDAAFQSANTGLISELNYAIGETKKFRREQAGQLKDLGEKIGTEFSPAKGQVDIGERIDSIVTKASEAKRVLHDAHLRQISETLGMGNKFEQVAITNEALAEMQETAKKLMKELEDRYKNTPSLNKFREEYAILSDFAGRPQQNLTADELMERGVDPAVLFDALVRGDDLNSMLGQAVYGFDQLRALKSDLIKLTSDGDTFLLGTASLKQLTAATDKALYDTLRSHGVRNGLDPSAADEYADAWREANAKMFEAIEFGRSKTIKTLASKVKDLEVHDVGMIIARRPEWARAIIDFVAESGGDAKEIRGLIAKGIWENATQKSLDSELTFNSSKFTAAVDGWSPEIREIAFGDNAQNVQDFITLTKNLNLSFQPVMATQAAPGSVMASGMKQSAYAGAESNVLNSVTSLGNPVGMAATIYHTSVGFATRMKAAMNVVNNPSVVAEILTNKELTGMTNDMLREALLNMKKTGVPRVSPKTEVMFLRRLAVTSPNAYKGWATKHFGKTGKIGAVGAAVAPEEDQPAPY